MNNAEEKIPMVGMDTPSPPPPYHEVQNAAPQNHLTAQQLWQKPENYLGHLLQQQPPPSHPPSDEQQQQPQIPSAPQNQMPLQGQNPTSQAPPQQYQAPPPPQPQGPGAYPPPPHQYYPPHPQQYPWPQPPPQPQVPNITNTNSTGNVNQSQENKQSVNVNVITQASAQANAGQTGQPTLQAIQIEGQSRTSYYTLCDRCQQTGYTLVNYVVGLYSCALFVVLLLSFAWIGCAYVPLLKDKYKDVEHRCASCGHFFGVYKRL